MSLSSGEFEGLPFSSDIPSGDMERAAQALSEATRELCCVQTSLLIQPNEVTLWQLDSVQSEYAVHYEAVARDVLASSTIIYDIFDFIKAQRESRHQAALQALRCTRTPNPLRRKQDRFSRIQADMTEMGNRSDIDLINHFTEIVPRKEKWPKHELQDYQRNLMLEPLMGRLRQDMTEENSRMILSGVNEEGWQTLTKAQFMSPDNQ